MFKPNEYGAVYYPLSTLSLQVVSPYHFPTTKGNMAPLLERPWSFIYVSLYSRTILHAKEFCANFILCGSAQKLGRSIYAFHVLDCYISLSPPLFPKG